MVFLTCPALSGMIHTKTNGLFVIRWRNLELVINFSIYYLNWSCSVEFCCSFFHVTLGAIKSYVEQKKSSLNSPLLCYFYANRVRMPQRAIQLSFPLKTTLILAMINQKKPEKRKREIYLNSIYIISTLRTGKLFTTKDCIFFLWKQKEYDYINEDGGIKIGSCRISEDFLA